MQKHYNTIKENYIISNDSIFVPYKDITLKEIEDFTKNNILEINEARLKREKKSMFFSALFLSIIFLGITFQYSDYYTIQSLVSVLVVFGVSLVVGSFFGKVINNLIPEGWKSLKQKKYNFEQQFQKQLKSSEFQVKLLLLLTAIEDNPINHYPESILEIKEDILVLLHDDKIKEAQEYIFKNAHKINQIESLLFNSSNIEDKIASYTKKLEETTNIKFTLEQKNQESEQLMPIDYRKKV